MPAINPADLTAEQISELAAARATAAAVKAAHVPEAVTNLAFRKALRAANQMTNFKTHFNGLTETEQEEWLFAPLIRRDSAILEAARVALNRTQAQRDALLRAAAEFDK
jgi:hypothetical protein